jgi:hypothetical protein
MNTESQPIDQASKVSHPPRLPRPLRITEQLWPEGTVPVVSICCITYNHEKFIRDAIEGFLMQETTFPVEILITDDCSTDNNAAIIREYERQYPQLFKVVYNEVNQYSRGVRPGRATRARAQGELIALCEGDDYWTSPQKLQKQVNYLDRHPERSGVVHWVLDEVEAGEKTPPPVISGRDVCSATVTINNLLDANVVTTCSVVFRGALKHNLSSHYTNLPMADWPLWIHLALQAPLGCIRERMAVYRRHRGGVWTGKRPAAQLAGAALLMATIAEELKADLQEQACQSFERYVRLAVGNLTESVPGAKFAEHAAEIRSRLAWSGVPPGLPHKFEQVVARVVQGAATALIEDKANKAWEAHDFLMARRYYAELAFGPKKSLKALAKSLLASTGEFGLSVKRFVPKVRGTIL